MVVLADRRDVGGEAGPAARDVFIVEIVEDAAVGRNDLIVQQIEDPGVAGDTAAAGRGLGNQTVQVQRQKTFATGVTHLMNQVVVDGLNLPDPGQQSFGGAERPAADLECGVFGDAEDFHRPPLGVSVIVDGTEVSRIPGHHHQLERVGDDDRPAAIAVGGRVIERSPGGEVIGRDG